ncbi:MAG TPA: hypothetical protein VMN99_14490 [Anaerolineales bacterium]|nr:hypothetical protein [Anaerolineales bacterium]
MAKRAKQSEPSEPEAGIVKVTDPSPAGDAPVEVNTIPEPPLPATDLPPRAASGPRFGERVGRFFLFLLRLVFLVIALSIIGVALYIVLPLLYQRYIRPVEQNTAQMMELQSRQEQSGQELAALQTRLETMESVQNQHDGSLTELDQRLSDIETEIGARTQSLAALEQMQSELQAQNEAATLELQRQIDVLKAMELLSRARLFMYQSNFGLARQDVQVARDVLATVQSDAPESLADDLDAVILRLDMTLSNLPDFPVAASDDLDIAWQILLSGLPEAQTTAVETPALTGTLAVTPEVTFTPTPPATVQPSATP